MRPPKRVLRFVILLIMGAIAGLWLWSGRMGTASTAQADATTPAVPTNPAGAVTSQPIPAAPSAAAPVASPSTPTTPVAPRFLGSTPDTRRAAAQAIEDRWPTAEPIAEANTIDTVHPTRRKRVRIVRTNFKYPLLRLEETVYADPETGRDVLFAQVAMVADHVLVKAAPGVDASTLTALVTSHGGTIRSIKPASQVYLVTVHSPAALNALPDAIDALKGATGVVTVAEPDFIVHIAATPNDTSFAQLYGLHNTGQTGGATDADIDAPEAWEITTGSRAVRVGVIDTGIDYNHPDLAANIWTNPGEIAGNGVDDDGNGYIDDVRGWDFVNNDADPMDDHYHGTHVAGTIGGVGNNSAGVVGVNWQVALVGLKFLSASGSGTTSDAVEAVAYANTLDLDLTSNSWGGGGFSQALSDVIAAAGTAGHLFIAAAGNSARNTDTSINYPSGYTHSNIIAVAATDHSDQLASFSNYGSASVDLAAPGVNTLSTAPGSSYRSLSGTSMATPHVAGAAALLLSVQPGLAAPELKAALLNSVDLLPALSGRVLTEGRLNVASALSALSGLGVSPATGWNIVSQIGTPLPPTATTFTLRNSGSTLFTWTAASNVSWANASLATGNLAPGATATVTVTLDANAASMLPHGTHEGVITFTNNADGATLHRLVRLVLEPVTVSVFAETFEAASLDPTLWTITGGANARAVVTTANLPHNGTRHLVMDATTNGTYARNEATLRLDLTGSSDLRLTFWAKGFNEESNGPPSTPFTDGADFDGVAISTDGVTWYEIQPLRPLSLDWQKYTVDLDAALAAHGLAYNSDFRIRFNQYDNYSAPTDGIAIDDILLVRIINKRLGLILPATLPEGGAALATLTAAPTPDTELVVHLSDASSTLVLPATVTLAAGQGSIDFPVSAPDDTLRNGTRSPVIAATAPGWGAAESIIRVLDDETAVLGLILPASATEGSTALTGTLTVTPAPDADVVVELFSDDTGELRVPATVVIPVGQTSAPFELLVVDDNRIDGSVISTITARVDNWTSASADLTIHDNEIRALTLTAPATAREGAANFTATVALSGTLATPLTVALGTDDTTELEPPAEVVVPAGQLSATASIAIVNDDLHDGPQTVRLIATAASFTTGETSVVVQDNDAHHRHLSAPPDTVLRNQPFNIVLTAEDIADQPIPNYSSDLVLSATDSSGSPVQLTPATVLASAFSAGRWSGSVTAGAYATDVRITITDTSDRSVVSSPFDVIAGPAASFVWTAPPSTLTVDTPFTATVSAVDVVGNPAVSFAGNVALSVNDNTANAVRILSWIGYADTTPTGEYENTKRAIRSHFTTFIETSTTVTDASDLAAALVDKDVFLVPEQESDFGNAMIPLGTAWAPVLQDFVTRGGTVIVCSHLRQEHRILTNSGLMTASKAYTSSFSHPVAKTTDTWLNEGVSASFTAYSISTYLASNGQPSLISQIYPYYPVLSREVGEGRVVLIGTDYAQPGTGMDRIIANAVRAARAGGVTMRAPVRPASATFSNGVWSGPLSVPLLGSDLSLRADTADGLEGISSSFASLAYTPPAGAGLVVTVPATVAEAAGTANASVSLASPAVTPVEITLASGSPAELTVPANITIAAGQTSASFTLTLIDDPIIDGDRDVVVSATAAAGLAGSAIVRVLDDETGTLTLTAPSTLAENSAAGIATVTVTPPAARPLTIALASSDVSAATVAATIVIPAGFSSVSFSVTPTNDTAIDGDQTTVITATVEGWSAATHSLTVTDNEPRTLQLTGASSIDEGAIASVGLGISGTLATDLIVTLASDSPAQLAAPGSVTIPAGQTSVLFQIQATDDDESNGSRTIRIAATAATAVTFTDAERDIVVRDDELHHFAFSTVPDAQSTHVPFAVTITALSVDDVVLTNYAGTATLSAEAANGDPVTFSPTSTGAFTNGAWTGNLTATTSATGVRVIATDGSVVAQSNAFDILGAPRISVAPSSIAVELHRDESATREMTISNSGHLPLTWSLSGVNALDVTSVADAFAGPVFSGGPERPKDDDSASNSPVYEAPRLASGPAISAPWAPRLETVLATLDAGHSAIRELIPGRYPFSDGVTGTNISDGGNDMYDGGNYLGTDLGTSLAYSDGAILSSAKLGASGGQYFTRKYDGLFVFAADLAGVAHFEITGNLGADGSGSTDTAILTQTRGGITYHGFVKRVYGTGDPSVNHLVIVADNGSVTHSTSTDTNSDQHRVSNLAGITRLYYLLYAGSSGSYIDNTSAQAVMSAFLDTVSTGDWMSVAPASGTIAPGASTNVTITFDSTALEFRAYTQTLRVSSNDPLDPALDIPISLTVADRVLHHFEFDPIPGQIRGAPFTVRLRALAADGLPVVSFAAPVALTANGSTLTPSTTTSDGWADGVWTGQATITTFGTGITLSADDGAGHSGLSNAFDAGSGPFAGFTWDTIPSPQIIDTPFPVALRAVDTGGNFIPAYTGTATLSALVPRTLANTGTDYSTDYYPFAAPYGAVVRQQVLYPASTLGSAPRRLNSLALNVTSTNPAASFSDWTIRLKTTTRTTLSGATFDSDGWTTVHVSTATPTVAGWTTFAFSTPFDYDGTGALLVDLSFRNASSVSNYVSTSVSYDSSIRSIKQTHTSASADPFTFTTATSSSYVPIIRFTSMESVPLRPASVTLVDGIWTGAASLAASSNPAQLRASSAIPAVFSDSNTFTVSPLPEPAPALPFDETWESGTFSPAWTLTGTGTHRSQITSSYAPRGGTRHLILDSSSYGTNSRNEATVTLNLAGRTGVVLSFWAKGFNETGHAPTTNPFTGGADFDGVAISTDGVTWYEVQALRPPVLTNTWQQFTVNLDNALASRGLAYNSAFRIRFNRYGYEYVSSGGIAVDDIAVTTAPVVAPTLVLPSTAAESSAPLAGTLSLPATRPDDTVFILSSSAPAKLALPATVTLPAGQASVAFTAAPINDEILDGDRTLTITATPPADSGLFPGTTTLLLTDDDAPTLTLSVSPTSVSENATAATATLTLGTPPAASLTVALASSDPTAATVPATLTLAPGQTTATFFVTPVNDTKIDGDQTTTLSATLTGAPPATALFTVSDNETTTLALSAATTTEGTPTNGSVSITGTLPSPLTVTLTSANPAQLTVPDTVTIPAGATSATFTLTAVDDTDTDGSVSVAITATATGFTSATASATARDNDLHHFTISPSLSSPQLANRTFTTTTYARTIDNLTATFNGTVNLTANASATVLPSTPTSITFASGYWSGPVSVNAPATGVTLNIDDGAGHTGVSSAFNITVGALDHFAFAPIASPQSATMPVPLTITARDIADNIATSFAGTATLSATMPSRLIGTGTTSNTFPFRSYQSRTQSIYPASELGGPGRLSGMALDVTSAPGSAVANLTIRVKSTALSAYSSYAWESTGWTTVYQGSPTIGTTGWFQCNFTTPFDYDGTSNLMVDVSHNSTSYLYGNGRSTPTSATRTLYIHTSGQGDPLTWSGTTPSPNGSTGVLNLRLNIQHPAVLTPAVSGAFVNGVWSGNVTFATPATDVAIQATSGNALGVSNTFSVQTGGIPNLHVSTGNFTTTGYRGGPFIPATRSWTLTNSSSTPLTWSASKTVSWFSLSPASGTLDGGASTTVTASFAPDSLALTLGTYTDSIVFFNQTNGLGSTVRDVSLTIIPAGDLAITPDEAFDSTGEQGGPFTPATTSWTLSNPGDASLSWTATKTVPWLSLDTTGGILAPGATSTITATLATAANTLDPGAYHDVIAFTNTTTGRGDTTRTVNLTVRPGPPRIITPPVATLTIPHRRSAVLTVTAGTDDTLTYQWYRGTPGTITDPVPGATGATLVTLPLSTDTSYWVRLSNAVATTDSPGSAVTVQPALTLNLLSTGYNFTGQLGDGTTTNRSRPLQVANDVAQASLGAAHAVFVKADGTLWAMGLNTSGQLGDGTNTQRATPVQIATNVVHAATNHYFTVFLKTDGTLWGMGTTAPGIPSGNDRTVPTQIASDVVQASAGYSHLLFVKTDGSLWAVGSNSSGQLGDETTVSRSTPVRIATGVAHVSAGANHSLFLKTNGTLWSMGYNFAGQLGDGTKANRSTPVQAASGVASISAGANHSLFIKTDGTLWAMGDNSSGKLGDGGSYNVSTPVQVSSGVDQVSGGHGHTLLVKTNGTLWAMGSNFYGPFGDGSTTSRSTPWQVNSAVTEAVAGNSSSLFLSRKPGFVTQPAPVSILPGQTATLSVVASGPATISYQWYQGTTGITSAPVPGATTAVFITPGLTATTSYWVRVTNSFGSTDSTTATVTVNTPPVITTPPAATAVLPGRNAVLSVSATGGTLVYQWYRGNTGDTSLPVPGATGPTLLTQPMTTTRSFWVRVSNLAGTTDSTTATVTLLPASFDLSAMGGNLYGQLGNGTTSTSPTPTPEFITSGVAQIASGGYFSLILKSDGTLWTTGFNSAGQLGNGTTTSHSTPAQVASGVAYIAAGGSHSLFVKTNGTLWAMGNNNYGQLGDGTTTNRTTPVQVATQVVQVAAGSGHTAFLKADGTLWSCGNNNRGQLGDGTNTNRSTPSQIASGVASLEAGSGQTFFLKADATLWAIGENAGGQLGDGTITHRSLPIQVATDVAQVSTQYYFSLIVKTNGTLWAVGANWYGQLGDGTTTDRYSPIQVATGVAQATTGDRFSLFVQADGTLRAMGKNVSGQLGDRTTTDRLSPVVVAYGVAVASAGTEHSLFLQIPPPVITTQPDSITVVRGETTTLSVAATGTGTLRYQWYVGTTGDISQPIAGATTNTFTTPVLITTTSYWVQVADFGATNSQTATVTIIPPAPTLAPEPVITGGTDNTVAWSAVPGATDYEVQAASTPAFTAPLTSGWQTSLSYTFPALTNAQTWHFRVRDRIITYPEDSWQQTSSTDFATGTATSIDTASQSGDAILTPTGIALRENFDGSTGWAATVFPDISAGTFELPPLSTGEGPATTPPLPINQNGDQEARLTGSGAHALTAANPFADGSVEAYLAPANRAALHYNGLLLRSSRSAGQLNAYGAILLFFADGTVKADFSRIVNNSVNGMTNWFYSGTTSFPLADNENIRARFSVQGAVLTLQLWRVSVSGGAVVETPIPFYQGTNTLTAIDTTYTAPGRAGIYSYTSSNQYTHSLFDDAAVTGPSVTYATSGSLVSPVITPASLHRWGRLDYTATRPVGTSLAIDVLDAATDTVLASNLPEGADLGALPALASTPAIRLRARLATTQSGLTPRLSDWSVNWQTPVSTTVESRWSLPASSLQDATAPTLALTSPVVVYSPSYTLAGTAFDTNGLSALSINGHTASSANAFADWNRAVTLALGENVFSVVATDNAVPGNITTRSYTITYAFPPDLDTDGLPDAWETAHGLDPSSSAAVNGALGDPDRDGLPNLLEYAFGLAPNQADAAPPYSVETAEDPVTDLPELRFTFRRLIHPGTLTYSLLTSSNLTTWTAPVPTPEELSVTPNPDGLTETVVVRIPLGSDPAFVRLQIGNP